jgi:dTDP-4-dehydrorhamnose reductase/SAM-dependent methyltransferase
MKIVIFGSNGMLGRYVLHTLNSEYNVISILRDEFDIFNDEWSKLRNILEDILEENDVIINCSGIIPQKYDSNQIKKYIKINTLFPHKLSEISNNLKCKLIHITTDCVFSGKKGDYYTEEDQSDINTIYGITKFLGEPENCSVIRTSIIGEEFNSNKSLLEWLISNKNKTIDGFSNHYWNGVTCFTLAKIIKEMISKNIYWKGVKHISSPEIISKAKLCSYINELYNLNITIIPKNVEYKNLSLSTIDYELKSAFKIKSIYDQLIEQKNANIIYGMYDNLTTCRFCNNTNLYEIFKFNDFPLSGEFLKFYKNTISEKLYPLTFLYCENCKTALVKEVIKQDNLFTNIHSNSYFYYSSTIPLLVTHFNKLFQMIKMNYPLKKRILEIGCNDGVFINNFVGQNYNIIGIDPSKTIEKIKSNEIIKYNTFFNSEVAMDILNRYGKQDVIVCCNCLAHINNINEIYQNIKQILFQDGILIVEVHYLKNIIDNLNFDFIYHEHMSYYSIKSFIQICMNNDFYLDNIEFIDIHGGSLRAFIRHKKPDDSVFYNEKLNVYIVEEDFSKNRIETLFDKLLLWKSEILKLIEEVQIHESMLLVGYGASGRTNMIINFLEKKFDIILDDSIHKINSLMPYYHTKIENSEIIYSNNNIKIIFILAWPYTKNVIEKHKKFIENGGIFIKILPQIERIDINNYQNYLEKM